MANWYFLFEFALPTITKVMNVYGQSFQYDTETKKVLNLNGQMQLSDMRGNTIGFTREQIAKYGLTQGSLLEIKIGNADSLDMLVDSGIESIFEEAYKEKFDREYAC